MSDDAARNMARRIRGGFTIVELLIVIAMIILLLSILVVAVNRAGRTAQITNTRALMNSISQALVRFKEDVGYYPPVLAPEDPSNPADADEFRQLRPPPNPDPNSPDDYPNAIQQWYSITTLADYFLGYGDDQQDAYEGIARGLPSGPAETNSSARLSATPYVVSCGVRIVPSISPTVSPG